MLITDRLAAEHQVFLRQLVFLESLAQGQPEALAVIAGTVRGPLEEHARAEEELLFPALEEKIGADAGPLPVMVAEHRDIQATLASLCQASSRDAGLRLAEHLTEVLRAHIAKEDDVLFPLARGLLGADQLEELETRYSRAPSGSPLWAAASPAGA